MKKYVLYLNDGTDNKYLYESNTILNLGKLSGISISSLYRIKTKPDKYNITDIRKKKHKGYNICIVENNEKNKINTKKKKEKKKIIPIGNTGPIIKINMSEKIILSFD
jgi:hypothetical protein